MYRVKYFLFIICALLIPLEIVFSQTCQNDYPASTPTERFEIRQDGSVYDTRTELIWQRCLQGLSGGECDQGAVLTVNWDQALQIAEAETGWRLPNIKELQSIVERQCVSPALNNDVFPDNASNVWSSSPNAYNTYRAWFVGFGNGYTHYFDRHNAFQVRLVRSGQ